MRVHVDQAARQDALDELLDAGVRNGGEHTVGLRVLRIGQHGVADPADGRARHRVTQAPEEIAPGDGLADRRLHVARLARADGVHGLQDQAGDEIQLDRQTRAPVEHRARQEAGAREEHVRLLHVFVHEDVLPRHQRVVENEDGVVLVHPARERIVEGAAHHVGRHGVGGTADQLDARRVHGGDKDHRELLRLDGHRGRMRDEVVMGERRAGGDDFGAAHDQSGVGLLLDVHIDVGHLVRRAVAVHRRLNERVIHEQDALLSRAVPAPRVVLVGRIVVGVGSERGQEGRLVVGRAAHPPIGQARPGGDRVTRGDQFVGAPRGAE